MPLWQAFVFSPGKDLNSKAGVLYLESGESHVNSRLWTTFDDSESSKLKGQYSGDSGVAQVPTNLGKPNAAQPIPSIFPNDYHHCNASS